MILLPFTSPRLGIAIRAERLTLVEFGRDWWRAGRRPRARIVERPLPPGLVRPTPHELNITEPGKLADELQMLLDRRGPVPATLSLPDLAVRTALFEFETLPSKAQECEALIRWRVEKELGINPASGHLASRVYRRGPAGSGPARVLAVFVRRTVLEQYEQVCERAGLIPVRTSFGSLALLALDRPLVKPTGEVGADEGFLASIADDALMLIGMRGGVPVFLRTKLRHGGPVSPLLPQTSLSDEVVATLQFYDEGRHQDRPPSARPLWVLGPGPVLDAEQQATVGVQERPVEAACLPVFGQHTPTAAAASAAAGLLAGARCDLHLSPPGYGLLRLMQAALVLAILSALVSSVWLWAEGRHADEQAFEHEQATRRVQDANARFIAESTTAGYDLRAQPLTRLSPQVTFANQLLEKGSFSWTRFLGDLEEAIAPQISFSSVKLSFTDSTITLIGSALTLKDLTAQIDKLESHPSFRNVVLSQHRVQEDRQPQRGVEKGRLRAPRESVAFTMTVVYERTGAR